MQKLKLRRADYKRILIGSDFHYDHQRDFIYIPRGFNSPEEHSTFLRKEVLGLDSNDCVILLGDQALNSTPERVESLMNSFPCETYVIWGNHNAGIKQLYDKAYSKLNLPKGGEYYPLKIAPNVTHLGECFELDVDDDRLYCRHFAALIWDEGNKGRMHLCGHSHAGFRQLNPGQDGVGQILDCGVENTIKENGSAFFEIDEALRFLRKKKVAKWDHH